MGWSEPLPNPGGNPRDQVYRAVWRDSDGRKRSKSAFPTAAKAKRYASEQEAKLSRGEVVDDGRGPTWDQWRVEWLKLRRVSDRTRVEDERRIRLHIAPRWGSERLAHIKRADVQTWVNELDDHGMAAATVRRVYATFSASMKAALVHNRITASPCSHIKLPDIPPAHERYFTRAEFVRVLEFMREPYRSAVILLIATGMRFNELAGLHWSRVDFESRTITVAETFDPVHRKMKPFPKSKKPRPVPMPDLVADVLRGLLDELDDEPRDGCGVTHADRSTCRSGLVLTNSKGGPIDNHNMRDRHWLPALRLAGIDPGRLHDLRHTYASWLAQDGQPLQVVQELLGHASITTTQRYSHFGNTAYQSVRDVFDR